MRYFTITPVFKFAVRLARHLRHHKVDAWTAAVRAAEYYGLPKAEDDILAEMCNGEYDLRAMPHHAK